MAPARTQGASSPAVLRLNRQSLRSVYGVGRDIDGIRPEQAQYADLVEGCGTPVSAGQAIRVSRNAIQPNVVGEQVKQASMTRCEKSTPAEKRSLYEPAGTDNTYIRLFVRLIGDPFTSMDVDNR